ncbi:MAG: hypothetical protein CL873_01140 [Dehalococcoidales bacterium]|jgi:hypothetical protein|nr:hypothetical protein [Dehalococcoidales bacterium]|tara:strand:- start:3384 stop:4409 length:1026 start_codon:yes stop_codon:yes gene_type:complete
MLDLESCQEAVNIMEAIKGKLENTPFAQRIALAVHDSQNLNMEYWNNVAISALALSTAQQTPLQVQLTPDTLLTREILAWILSRWAKNIRAKIFGSEEKPFESYDKALEWVLSQSEEIERREGKKLGQQGERSSALTLFLSLPFSLGEPEKGYYRIRFKENSKIHEFVKEINKAVRTTRLEKVSLITYILLDAKPFVLPYEITAEISAWGTPAEGGGFYSLRKEKVTVDIYSDLTFSEWKQIYGHIKKLLGNKKGRVLEQRHLGLYHMVEDKGCPPVKMGVTAFWKGVLSEWNKNHKNNQYSSWKEIQRAYNRAMERITSKLFSDWGGLVARLEGKPKKRG